MIDYKKDTLDRLLCSHPTHTTTIKNALRNLMDEKIKTNIEQAFLGSSIDELEEMAVYVAGWQKPIPTIAEPIPTIAEPIPTIAEPIPTLEQVNVITIPDTTTQKHNGKQNSGAKSTNPKNKKPERNNLLD